MSAPDRRDEDRRSVLFRGAPEDGNLHGVAGVKDEPPPEDLRCVRRAALPQTRRRRRRDARADGPGPRRGQEDGPATADREALPVPEWLRDPKSTRPFRYSLQIREQRQRRGCVAQKLAPEAQREAPGPSLRDRLRGLVAGPFEGEGRALEYVRLWTILGARLLYRLVLVCQHTR